MRMVILARRQIVMHVTNKIMKMLSIQITSLLASQPLAKIVIQRVDGLRQPLITMDNTSRYIAVSTMGSGMIVLIAILIKVIFQFSLVSLVTSTINLIWTTSIRVCKDMFIKVKNVMPVTRMEKLMVHSIISSPTFH